MKIIKLKPGETAPADTDCIKINETAGGKFTLVASALTQCAEDDNSESVALVGSDPYPSFEDAEAAGLAWANELCVETLYIETGGEPEPTKSGNL